MIYNKQQGGISVFQKINPHPLRVGVIKNWDSRWYSETNSKKVQCCGLRVGQVKPWNTQKHRKSRKKR